MNENIKILVVEDEIEALELLSMTLEDAGYEVIKAENAEKAIAYYMDFEPLVVLMDINLGSRLDGIHLAEIMQNKKPCVLIYTSGNVHRHAEALKTRHSTWITKPFNYGGITYTIQTQINNFRIQNEQKQPKERVIIQNQQQEPKEHKRVRVPKKERCGEKVNKYIKQEDIILVEKISNDQVQIVDKTGKEHKLTINLSPFLESLTYPNFIKVSGSAFINLDYLDRLREKPNKAVLKSQNQEHQVFITDMKYLRALKARL